MTQNFYTVYIFIEDIYQFRIMNLLYSSYKSVIYGLYVWAKIETTFDIWNIMLKYLPILSLTSFIIWDWCMNKNLTYFSGIVILYLAHSSDVCVTLWDIPHTEEWISFKHVAFKI